MNVIPLTYLVIENNASLIEKWYSKVQFVLIRIYNNPQYNLPLIVIDVPFVEDKKTKNKYSTMPLGIITYKNYLITLSVKETEVLNDVMENRVKYVVTAKKSRFLIQILHRVATLYIKYLSMKQIYM